MTLLQPDNRRTTDSPLANQPETFLFDLTAALPGRVSSHHTQRAYYRWVDTYLVDLAGWEPTEREARRTRMSALPVHILRSTIDAPQLRAWLGRLVQQHHGKQSVSQARAAIVTLASILSEAGWLDDYTSAAIANVRAPNAESGQRPGRWLSTDEVKVLMMASRRTGTSSNQSLRNELLLTILCVMALRREEVSAARWGDLTLQNNRPVLRVHGKGRKVATVDVPRPVMRLLVRWRSAIETAKGTNPTPKSPIIRRLWKGGRISKHGLSTKSIWDIVQDTATVAGMGNVAPHDLRRSVAGALHESGVPIEKISRLLRHSNVAITERYLSRLPMPNEGGILMSDLLGMEDDEDDDYLYT